MHIEKQVVCISAGMLRPKKEDNIANRSNMYLNYGLLGLASILEQRGWNPIVFHGHFERPTSFVARLHAEGVLPAAHPLLVSIPSSFALQWCKYFCAEVKARWPEQLIIVGGRWVTADDASWLRHIVPDVDLVVFGTAENTVHNLLYRSLWPVTEGTESSGRAPSTSPSPRLNYQLLDGHLEFTPSFEVSRGCGRGCNFCAEATTPLAKLKEPAELVAEIGDALAVYGTSNINAYLESSFFQPSTKWIADFGTALKTANIEIKWRTETRVDNITPAQIGMLAQAGLAVLDLGLETASHRQILAMDKSPKPEAYLRKASAVLKACAEHGIWAKVNILLYPGETEETVAETVAWLEAHRDYIKGLSVGPTIVFRYGKSSATYLQSLAALGAHPVSSEGLDRDGYVNLHMSRSMSYDRAIEIAKVISKSFMSERDYYDLKAFSYLPRSMTYAQFSAYTRDICDAQLPYRRE